MKEIEALNVVRQMVADGQVSQEVAEKYFPELAESEDERIKKAIYYVIANTPYGLISNTGFTVFQMKDWLDKQGEQKSAVIIPKFKVGDKIKLAKEPKYTPSEIVAIKNDAYYFDEFVHLPFSRQDEWELVEQKPVDNVETKFHEGDWVILTAGELSTTLQIVKVDTDKRLYWFNDSSYLPIVDEECLHLWTIQDAKDGDVLYAKISDEEWLYLYNNLIDDTDFPGLLEKSWINSYCCYRQNDSWSSCEKQEAYPVNEYSIISPATKEQRDLLFQKMKEAGYEWDAERKQLKKIEQKPVWSEEDEKQRRQIERIVSNDGCTKKLQEQIHNWFESLKGRVQAQSQWRPSAEQMRVLVWCKPLFAEPESKGILESLIDDLKKLKS